MKSVQRQLATGMFTTLALVFVALGIGLGIATRSVVEAYMETRLDHDAENLLSALRLGRGGGVRLRAQRANPIFLRVYSGHYFRITGEDFALRSRSLWQDDLNVPLLAPGESVTLRDTGPNDEPLLLRVHGYRKAGQNITVAVAEDLTPIESQIVRWQTGFAVATVVALLGLLVVQQWLLRRSFAPLDRVRDEVGDLESGERRSLSETVPSEALALVRAINRLLGLLDERLQRSRKAAGNLAHALKAPLSVLAQLKDDPGLRSHPELSENLDRQVGVIRARVERELKRSRLTGGVAPGARFDPAQDLSALVGTLKSIYRDRNLSITTDFPDSLSYSADREDMLELLGNLTDNACKWASENVHVGVTEDRGLLLTVEDDGPGVKQGDLQRLQRRGERLDESTVGHGLGLAIAQDIIRFYGGDIVFDRSPEMGGLRVRVTLPIQP